MNVTVAPGSLEDAWLAFMISSAAAKLAMRPLELDGYLTGVAVSPEMIRPRLWLDPLWRNAPFDDLDQANAAMAGIMARYNGILREIDQCLEQFDAEGDCDYRPAFINGTEKPAHDTVRTWMKGFERAMRLAPAVWIALAGDKRTVFLLAPLVGFIDADDGEPFVPANNIDELLDEAAAAIPRTLLALRKLSQFGALRPLPSRRNKIGRNDPCPCGSGKKYKRCCAA